MTMPAMPMNEAAERYSPEIAEAFQPTDTARPATKKSEAVLDLRADQKPIQMVAATVMSEKQRIHGSICFRESARPEVLASRTGFTWVLAPCELRGLPGRSSGG